MLGRIRPHLRAIGSTWQSIWIKESYDQTWRSGWRTSARIDEKTKTWYAAARIPLRSVSDQPVKAGARWRANLYRIE